MVMMHDKESQRLKIRKWLLELGARMQKTAKRLRTQHSSPIHLTENEKFYVNMRKWSKGHEIYENIFKLKAKKK